MKSGLRIQSSQINKSTDNFNLIDKVVKNIKQRPNTEKECTYMPRLSTTFNSYLPLTSDPFQTVHNKNIKDNNFCKTKIVLMLGKFEQQKQAQNQLNSFPKPIATEIEACMVKPHGFPKNKLSSEEWLQITCPWRDKTIFSKSNLNKSDNHFRKITDQSKMTRQQFIGELKNNSFLNIISVQKINQTQKLEIFHEINKIEIENSCVLNKKRTMRIKVQLLEKLSKYKRNQFRKYC